MQAKNRNEESDGQLTLWHFRVFFMFFEELVGWLGLNLGRTHRPVCSLALHRIILHQTPELRLMPATTNNIVFHEMYMITSALDQSLVTVTQKGKTSLDFTEARDSEWQWHQLGHMQVCTSFQTGNHTSTPPLNHQ